MKKIKRMVPIAILVAFDIVCVVLSLVSAFLIRYTSSQFALNHFFGYSYIYLPALVIIFLLVSVLLRRYTGVLKHADMLDAVYQFIVVVISFTLFYLFDQTKSFYLPFIVDYKIPDVSVFVFAAAIAFLITMTARFAVRIRDTLSSKIRSAKIDSKKILIFGAGEAGVFFKRKQDNHPEDKLRPVVFIDDDEELIGKRICGIPVYGNREKMAEAIEKFEIDEVVVAIPTANREVFKFALDICKRYRCRIQRFGTLDDVDLNKAVLTNINYEDLLHRVGVNLNMSAVSNFIKDKTVLVTGGVGSIGSEICRQVLSFGCKKLVIFDFNENGLYEINNELLEIYDSSRYELRLGSVRDSKRLNEVFNEFKPDVVFHAAAHKHVPMSEINPKEAVKNNVFGTYKTAMAAINHKVDKFILISTDKAVNPTSIMGATKRIAELVVQMLDSASDTDFAAVRFGNVLGSNGSVVPFFSKQISSGGPVTVTHRDMRRYFMTIPEAVQLVLEAGAMAYGGEIFVLEMGEPVKIYDLACDLIRLSGYEPDVDIKIEFTGLRPGEKLFEEIHLEAESFDKTANEQIYIMKPVERDDYQLSGKIKELGQLADGDSFSELFKKVKDIVPTFDHTLD